MGTVKAILHEYLRDARAANLRKLQGFGEYDLRRPMTPTGSNLLGVMKHLGGMEYGYLGEVFGRTLQLEVPGDEDPLHGADMWARADESREFILDWYRTACTHADETIDALELDSPGAVPHWPDGRQATTLAEMMARVLGEENRHGGHLDIVAELIDGRGEHNNADARDWPAYVGSLQAVAEEFR